MFSRRRDTAKISDKTPVFHVRYVGNTETYVASGRGCSYAPVQRLWDNSPDEKHLRKVAVHINPMGIRLEDTEKREEELTRDFPIEGISFCNADRAVNERIFSWICRNEAEDRLDCHAVLCSSKQKAQTMTVVLSRAFQIAYKDWRAHNRNRDTPRSASARLYANGANASKNQGNGSQLAATAAPLATSPGEGKVSNTVMTSSSSSSSSPVATPASSSHPTATSPHNSESSKSTHLSDDVNIMAGNGAPKPVTSSLHGPPTTSSGFMSSSIMDPDMEGAILGMNNLNADYDLDSN